KGFEALRFPANNFGGQEPGTDAEIQEFCQLNYTVSFPLFQKASVAGDDKQPLYARLTRADAGKRGDAAGFRGMLYGHASQPNPSPEVLWDFEKFLINKDGSVAARFSPNVAPGDPELVAAIEEALAA